MYLKIVLVIVLAYVLSPEGQIDPTESVCLCQSFERGQKHA